jgi:hypothetical protein
MPARLITQEEYQELVQQGVLRDVLVISTPPRPRAPSSPTKPPVPPVDEPQKR